jgi:Ca2+-binding EF-hand superfamily protein
MHDCWGIFDLGGAGTISRLQFEEVYLLFKIYPKREEMMLTFQRYDKDKDQLLSYKEFVEMMAPRDERYRDVLMQRKAYN